LRIPKELLWLLAIFFVQQTSGITDWGIDLPLIFTALAGLRTNAPKAAAWGFTVGTVQDLLSSGWIGPNIAAKTLMGILSSLSQKHIYREKIHTQTFLIFLMSLFQQFFIWLLLKWDGTAPPASEALGILIHTVLMTTAAGVVVCFFVVKFRRRRFDPATA